MSEVKPVNRQEPYHRENSPRVLLHTRHGSSMQIKKRTNNYELAH